MDRVTSIIILIICTILAVFFIKEVHWAVHWIDKAHNFLLAKLALIISGGEFARIMRASLALIIIPLVLALIPAFIYWIFRRRMLPFYMSVVWVIWFVLLTLLAY